MESRSFSRFRHLPCSVLTGAASATQLKIPAQYALRVDANKWRNRPRPLRGIGSRSHLLVHRPSVVAKRIGALLVAGILVTIVAPVLADESNSTPATEAPASETATSLSASDTSTASQSPTPSESASATSSPAASNPDSSDTQTASASPSPKPPSAIASQGMRVDLPTVLPVDPRALTRVMPAINLSGPQFLLACLNSSTLIFDLQQKNVPDSISGEELLLAGDFSQMTMISGTTPQVEALINSSNGLRMVSLRGAISGASASLSFVAVSRPVLSASICDQSINTRTLSFRPLGLGQELRKNTVILKK